jgi:hypothetical protein
MSFAVIYDSKLSGEFLSNYYKYDSIWLLAVVQSLYYRVTTH